MIDTPDGPSETVALVWSGESIRRADELLRPMSADDRNAVDEAKDFLLQALHDGERECRKIYGEAREAGISERALERAKAGLGVRSLRKGTPGVRGGGLWFWALPAEAALKSATPALYGDLGDLDDLNQTRVNTGVPTHLDIKDAIGIEKGITPDPACGG